MPRVLTSAAVGLVLCALSPQLAWAQTGDQPIPYPGEDEDKPRELPQRSEPTYQQKEIPIEAAEREKPLGRLDDPNVGLAFELVSGVMLLETSRGQGIDPVFGGGVRATWEWGRLLENEYLHESLFADAQWLYSWLSAGTAEINEGANYHAFTLAPAFTLLFGQKPWFGPYVQVGGGVSFESDTLKVGSASTQISALRPVLQYGLGLRGRPPLNPEGTLRLSFRVEATRFRRGYVDDLLIAGSLGVDF